ncbi:MAG: hypothetical protein HKN09_09670, partial [Saprospiraceae bacterium]|nr:hypothetical protein [Saprospiraceae bacterium]
MKYLIFTLLAVCSFIQIGHSQVTFNMEVDAALSNNEFTYVDVTVEDFENIVSFQFAMLWNPDVFKVEAVNNYNASLQGFGPATTALPDETNSGDDGIARMIWFDPSTAANSLPDGSQLFTIKFSHTGNACESSELKFGDASPTWIEIIDGNLLEIDLLTTPITMTIPGSGCGGSTSCNEEVTVNPQVFNCEVNLTEDQLINGNAFANVTINPSVLTSANLNLTTDVTVTYTLDGVTEQCVVEVTYIDNVPPVAVVVSDLTVSLSTDPATPPSARVFAETVDEGSFDNCSAVTFSPPYFDFDCSDIGVQTIVLQVEDEAGNTNQAWTTVTIEYNSNGPIDLTCPEDVVVDCSVDIVDPAIIESTLGFGIGTAGCLPVYSDVFDYDANADGDINDTFTIGGEEFNERFSIGCNNGPVVRTWSIPGTSNTCDQLIVLREAGPFDGNTMIDWPYSLNAFVDYGDNDGTVGCGNAAIDPAEIELLPDPINPTYSEVNIVCKDDLCELPLIDEENVCNLVGMSLESDTFFFEGDACLKIIQTYTVIDWCSYDPIAPDEEGIWTWTVIAKFNDSNPPQLVAEDMMLACDNALSVTATATDFSNPSDPASGCTSDELRWQVYLDLNNDLTFEREWSSFVEEDLNTPNDPLWSDDNLEDNLVVYGYSIPDVRVGNKGDVDNANSQFVKAGTPYSINIPGNLFVESNTQHRVVWKAYDQCGNVTSVTSYFTLDRSIDNIAPTPYCINFVTAKLEDPDGNGPEEPQVDIWAIDFNAGSFDNCTSKENLRYSFTSLNPDTDITFVQGTQSAKITFDQADLTGASFKDYDLKVYVWDESDNQDFCAVKLRITEDAAPCLISNISCGDYLVELNDSGFASITTDQLDISYSNPCNLSNIQLSFSPIIPDQTTLNLSCSEKGNTLQEVYVYVNGLLSGQCKALIKVIDPFNACPFIEDEVTLKFNNYVASMGDEICVQLQTDGFNDINGLQGSMEWDPAVLSYLRVQNFSLQGMSPSLFNETDTDGGHLSYIWFDLSGNSPATIPPGGSIFEVCFDVIGEEGDISPLLNSDTPTPVQVARGSEALPLNLVSGSVTVGSSNCDTSQDQQKPVPYCINLSTALIQAPNNVVELWAIDFDAGSFDNCSKPENLRFTFSDTHPELDSEFVGSSRSSKRNFTLDDVDPVTGFTEVKVYVWDEADNKDFCIVNLRLVDNTNDPCHSNTEDNIQWPLAEISINQAGLSSQDVSPELLVSNFSFNESDVMPTYINTTCVDGLAQTYADQVFNISAESFKIIREWTVLDWYTANYYQYYQLIRINLGNNLICDFLPNTAPVGDCDSGHTLDDDVEWPADIMIADHRITPDELETFSGIPSKDSRPVFYNADASLYTSVYIDVLISLSTTTLILDRQWTVGRSDNPTVNWEYSQKITVDITMFSNLVTVNTIFNRPMPNVNLNDQTATDLTGS